MLPLTLNRRAFGCGSARLGLALSLGLGGQSRADNLLIQGLDGWLFAGWESLNQSDHSQIRECIGLMAMVSRWLKAQGTELVCLVVPMKAVVHEANLPNGRVLSDAVKHRYSYVLSQLQSQGLLTLDLLSVLNSMEQKGDPRWRAFFRTDYHWTLQAAELSAEAAAALVKQNVKFNQPPAGGSVIGDFVYVRRYGDLAMRFLSAEQRMALKRDVFRIRSASPQTIGLLDEAKTEVYVVGNSFSQLYHGFPQMLSHKLNRPVGLHWKPGQFGHWFTLLEYLESNDFQQLRPRVIVWQLNEPRTEAGPDSAREWDASARMRPEVWLRRAVAAINR